LSIKSKVPTNQHRDQKVDCTIDQSLFPHFAKMAEERFEAYVNTLPAIKKHGIKRK
jgi:hypothetical protein